MGLLVELSVQLDRLVAGAVEDDGHVLVGLGREETGAQPSLVRRRRRNRHSHRGGMRGRPHRGARGIHDRVLIARQIENKNQCYRCH